ncbi:MAG: hypothetical protein MZV70_50250 [Desulfobacterales bacterium]|nr:hypothetical protein [Desulfobacterales bacterium]
MFNDALWGANFLTILVTFSYLVLAIVILHPLKEAPGGMKFITTLSQNFHKNLGALGPLAVLGRCVWSNLQHHGNHL